MWQVNVSKKMVKQSNKLPKHIFSLYINLLIDLKRNGPYRNNWANYSSLKGKKNVYHCHIKKGKPTYVVIWEIVDKHIKIMEVTYVGTHEKVTY